MAGQSRVSMKSFLLFSCTRITLSLLAVASFSIAQPICLGDENVEQPSAEQVFATRIMPIFNSPKPSSCVQCHLASVDLKDYIKPSAEETFRTLLQHDLVDIDNPSASKILNLISMGEMDEDKGAQLLHRKTRELEFAAFQNWLEASCRDEKYTALASEVVASERNLHPTTPDAVIRHTRKNRLLDSFTRNVWSQRMRCFPCHTPSEIDADNPMHQKPGERYREYVAQYGAKMDLFKSSPLLTMKSLLASAAKKHDDRLPLLNLEKPTESLLVLKPTAKLPGKGDDGQLLPPSSALPVSHVGGLKMHVDDFSYKAFVSWIEDCAATVNGTYETAEQLPQDNWIPTEFVLRIMATPEDWPKMEVIQMVVYPMIDGHPASDPIAFTQTKIAPRGNAVGTLFLFGTPTVNGLDSPNLHDGSFQVRVYLDAEKRLAAKPSSLLTEEDLVGETTVDAKWVAGFKNAVTIQGDSFRNK